jgi:hypothetical protein
VASVLPLRSRRSYDDRRGTGKTGIKLLLALALAAKQNAAVGVGIMLDPFDPAAAGEEFINGLLVPCRGDFGRQRGLLVRVLTIRLYALSFVLVAGIGLKSAPLTSAAASMFSSRRPTVW